MSNKIYGILKDGSAGIYVHGEWPVIQIKDDLWRF